MTVVVEGFRWALVGPAAQVVQMPGWMCALSIGVTVAVLVGGLIYFRNTERTFADVV
jgi:lipopolysaccharide transport system permease protein